MQGFFFSQMKGIYTKPKITLYLLMKDGMLSPWDQEQWGTRTSALTTFIQYWKFWPVQSGKKKKKFRLEKRNYNWYNHLSRIPRWLSGKESACNAGDAGLIPELGRSGEGNGNPLQYSCLGNPMDRWAQQAAVHGVTTSQTEQLNNNKSCISSSWWNWWRAARVTWV